MLKVWGIIKHTISVQDQQILGPHKQMSKMRFWTAIAWVTWRSLRGAVTVRVAAMWLWKWWGKANKESNILQFIKNPDCRSYFIVVSILRRYDFGYHGAFLFPEFQLGNTYRADFLIVGSSSNGHEFIFVELESPKGKTTMNDKYLGEAFREGLNQIDDWTSWLDKNFPSLKETFDKFKKLRQPLPDEFVSMNRDRIHYVVIAGRRSDFTQEIYELRMRCERERNCSLLHYDNLIDDATKALEIRAY
jgi:hypothetical protein